MINPFSDLKITIHGVMCLTSSITSIIIGLTVLRNDFRNSINRSFFLITLFGTIWLFTFAFVMMSVDRQNALFWISADYFLAVPYISPSVYLFTQYWSGKRINTTAKIGYAIGIILSLVSITIPNQVWSLRPSPAGTSNYFKDSVIGWAFFIAMLLHFFLFSVLGMINLLHDVRSSLGKIRTQKMYFIVAYLVGYTGSIDFLAAKGMHVYPFGYISFNLFILIIGYAIFKYQLLDIRVVIRRITLLIGIYVILLVLTWPVSTYALRTLLSSGVTPVRALLFLSTVLALVLSIGPFIYAHLVRNNYWLRGNVAAGLTHELKSPLSAIQSATEMISENIRSAEIGNHALTAEYVQMIQNNVNRLEIFVKDLLILAKDQDDQLVIEKQEADITKLITDTIQGQQISADRKGIDILFAEKTPVFVSIDPIKIHQVISNLLSNAIKFSDGKPINVQMSRYQSNIQISVRDNGTGIAQKNLNRVFDKFFQIQPTAKGSGIGLSIAKTWVEAHGGKIWAESDGEGEGTTVTFTLPIG